MKRRVMWAFLAVVAVVTVVAVVSGVLISASTATEIRKAQVINSQRAKDTQTTLGLVQDCTSPGGACYERGRRQTADAVGSINRVVILAAACSTTVPPDRKPAERQRAIEACVLAGLPTTK